MEAGKGGHGGETAWRQEMKGMESEEGAHGGRKRRKWRSKGMP